MGHDDEARMTDGIGAGIELCHRASVKSGWWSDLATGAPKERNPGELQMLMVSELGEMMEGTRKNKMDDHLPHRKSEEVEAADLFIRLMDYCGGRKLDLAGAVVEKMAYNAQRADHKVENRKLEGGKQF